ncbi:MAG: hypothetical protein KUG69_10490 [Marinosulfonomonas sp.]|nr:hypothetical protein [Marinosulfonomonas sp.]
MNTLAPPPAAPSRWIKPAAVFGLVFGVMTIFSGGNVLFGPPEAQELAGNFIQFVVWFNFLAGIVYVVASVGLWLDKKWAGPFAAFIAIATAIVALGFAIMVLRGEAYEMRTVGALAFRFTFWAVVAFLTQRATRQT